MSRSQVIEELTSNGQKIEHIQLKLQPKYGKDEFKEQQQTQEKIQKIERTQLKLQTTYEKDEFKKQQQTQEELKHEFQEEIKQEFQEEIQQEDKTSREEKLNLSITEVVNLTNKILEHEFKEEQQTQEELKQEFQEEIQQEDKAITEVVNLTNKILKHEFKEEQQTQEELKQEFQEKIKQEDKTSREEKLNLSITEIVNLTNKILKLEARERMLERKKEACKALIKTTVKWRHMWHLTNLERTFEGATRSIQSYERQLEELHGQLAKLQELQRQLILDAIVLAAPSPNVRGWRKLTKDTFQETQQETQTETQQEDKTSPEEKLNLIITEIVNLTNKILKLEAKKRILERKREACKALINTTVTWRHMWNLTNLEQTFEGATHSIQSYEGQLEELRGQLAKLQELQCQLILDAVVLAAPSPNVKGWRKLTKNAFQRK